jgi:hypothetical protein
MLALPSATPGMPYDVRNDDYFDEFLYHVSHLLWVRDFSLFSSMKITYSNDV